MVNNLRLKEKSAFSGILSFILVSGSFSRLELRGKNDFTKKEMTDPYVIPAMVHFLKCMTLQVRVPVLSEKRYFTWKRQRDNM